MNIEPTGRSPLHDLYWRDEILQVMYWMLGEGLGECLTSKDLARFLAAEPAALVGHLDRLAMEGDLDVLDRAGERLYRLTARGAIEGARRFADEFSGMQFGGHGECNRPGCVCRRLGPEACLARAERP